MNLRPRPVAFPRPPFGFLKSYIYTEYIYILNFNFIVDQLPFIIIMTYWTSILINRATGGNA